MTIGERLRKARKRLGKTQTAVATECGVKQPTVHAWEDDQCLPELPKFAKVAASYAIDVDHLMKAALAPRAKKTKGAAA